MEGSDGTYLFSGQDLTTHEVFIGRAGTGTLTQSGGTHEVGHRLYLGYTSTGQGTYNLDGGELRITDGAANEYIGRSGTGTFGQTAGTHAAGQHVYVGVNSGSSGTYIQRGGTFTVPGTLYLADRAGAQGTYTLRSTGELSAAAESIGVRGTGTFTQLNGINTVGEELSCGRYGAGSSGSYTLSGGSLLANDEVIGYEGTGTFTQSGGTNDVSNRLWLGRSVGSNGTYDLSDGKLTVSNGIVVGGSGTGTFTQTGGDCDPDLYLGYAAGSEGTYTISGGVLMVENLHVGFEGSGTLNIDDAAPEITVSESLNFGPDSAFTAVPGATIHMAGAGVENANTDPGDLSGLSHLTFIFEGGSAQIDELEVAGRDFGSDVDGFTDNFAVNTLILGGDHVGQVQLVDGFDNRPEWDGDEVLYVENLYVEADAFLDLNGLSLYYLEGTIDPGATIVLNGGELSQVCPGDLDGDGDTDQSDLGILLASFAVDDGGDFDGDGDTDQSDLGVLLADWGCGVP